MPSVAIEAAILTPLLIVQVILFPFVATTMSSYWSNASREVALQELASQMGSTIQQLYVAASRMNVSPGTITQISMFPREILSYSYTAKGSLRASMESNSGKLLILQVTLEGAGSSATAQTPLGPDVLWNEKSVFNSLSADASIIVRKFTNGTLLFSFG